ncbi:YihY/virulence factor BrkB family protein [Paucilactobacillus wasatchensis]|uniref:Ribonuclease BN n=1 Tax=Paucilactobacillus wasatchensis TaxID=1335616 RepID=A0A0D0YW64_9LACO|nr:YihY/virulence factor BrkB family protein [Paucilactobacillus wasatchensis]KIS03504.1 Ribonuclease BN [Paucilactobacillus wasatchensis]
MRQSAFNKVTIFFKVFFKHYGMAEVSSSAIVLAYYSLLSIFPAVIMVGNILPLVGLSANTVLNYLSTAIPPTVYDFIRPLISDFLRNGSGSLLSIGAIVTLWSTSQAVAAFQRSVNRAYGVAQNQNAIVNRVVSFIWMIVVIGIMAAIIIFFSVGQLLLEQLQPIIHIDMSLIKFVASIKWPITFGGLFITLCLLYYFVPNARVKWRYVFGGALLVTILWMLLSQVFSLYTHLFARTVTSYKTVGVFIVLMIWLDLSGMIVMIGATLNATIQSLYEGKIDEKTRLLEHVFSRIRHKGK